MGANSRAWLITWNIENWTWDNYEDICAETKTGKTILESWACVSKAPKIGDEVFLMKLGAEPRGIVGHGIVYKEPYEKEHYDSSKAAEGKREKAIDVGFDRLIDFEKEKILSQHELNEKCQTQYWSPQGSGIEIKQEELPTLKSLWKDLIETGRKDEWWPSLSEYDPGITVQKYHDLFLNEKVVRRTWLEALYELYQMPGHFGTCKQLGSRYGYAPAHYISYLSTAAGNIAKETGCQILPREEENARYWPVLFQGKHLIDKSEGSYCWKMRDSVAAAIEMLIEEGQFAAKENGIMVQFDHNMILYGPPGTGKTYNSVIYAVAICEGRTVEDVRKEKYQDILIRYKELRNAGRIGFTTFHQSYGYEEFIEGIKPILDSDSGEIGYVLEDGVFKSFCAAAGAVKVQSNESVYIKETPRIWTMILNDRKQECFANNEISLRLSNYGDDEYQEDDSISWRVKQMLHAFVYEMEAGDIIVSQKTSRTIDAIGVITDNYTYDKSSEYPRKRSVKWLVKDIDEDMLPYLTTGKKQLPGFAVSAFITVNMDAISSILEKYSGTQVVKAEQNNNPYVFIIDEINRGNISKIFGELITLIEDTKRAGASEAMEVTLPYSGELFSVPNNIYILGTMNTADRSIALMDTALRRRFEFVEMMPDSDVLNSWGLGTIEIDGQELKLAKMLDSINARIEYLYDREHTIGHAFFRKLVDDLSLKNLAGIFEKNIIPLLQEYFYEDYEKIQFVLGDNDKEDQYKFILDKPVDEKVLFKGNPNLDLHEKTYSIQHEAFLKLESYKQIDEDL